MSWLPLTLESKKGARLLQLCLMVSKCQLALLSNPLLWFFLIRLFSFSSPCGGKREGSGKWRLSYATKAWSLAVFSTSIENFESLLLSSLPKRLHSISIWILQVFCTPFLTDSHKTKGSSHSLPITKLHF